LINSTKKYLTKTTVITYAFKRSLSPISTGVNYSTPKGSRWKLTDVVPTEFSRTTVATSTCAA
jgi:hypothetical protein